MDETYKKFLFRLKDKKPELLPDLPEPDYVLVGDGPRYLVVGRPCRTVEEWLRRCKDDEART